MTTSGTDGEPTVRTAAIPAWPILLVSAALVVASWQVGWIDGIGRLLLGAPPVSGNWEWHVPVATAVPIVLAVALVWVAPIAVRRLRWSALLASAWASSVALTVALAAVDGLRAVAEPLDTRFEYRAVLGRIDEQGAGDFVRDFVDRLPGYPTHVRGHPVAMPLVFWLQERVGLTGAEWSAALVIGVGASAVVSVALVVRLLAGEAIARASVPFLVITPSLVWAGTSADAFFAGVVALAVLCFALAVHRDGRASWLLAGAAGGLGAFALHLTYGAVLMLVPLLALAIRSRRWGPVVAAVVGASVVTAAFVAGGFWWFDGLAATRVEYERGAGGYRPYWYFATLGNPGAFLLALGPAVVVALVRLRDARLWWLAGAALVGVVFADVSGLSKGEVERIWLPFVPLLSVAAAGLPRPTIRWWLAAQAAAAVLLQIGLDSPW